MWLKPLLATLLALSAVHAGAQAPRPPDALLGSWHGSLRFGDESEPLALVVAANPDGSFGARLWQPSLHLFGASIGELRAEAEEIVAPEWGLRLRLREGALDGTAEGYPGLALSLRRSAAPLPAASEPPASPPGPPSRWSFDGGARTWSAPAVYQGMVYANDVAGKLHAVSGATGALWWTRDLGAPLFGTPLVTAGAIFVLGDDGVLSKLGRGDGEVVWRRRLSEKVVRAQTAYGPSAFEVQSPTPALDGDWLFVPTADGVLHALDAATGSPRWQRSPGGVLRTSAVVAGNRVVVGSRDGFVTAYQRDSGDLLWRFDSGGPITGAPAVAADLVVVGSRSSLLVALRLSDGQPAWRRYYWMSWLESTPAVANGVLYLGSSDARYVRAIDARSGKFLWTTDVGGWSWGTPLLAGRTVLVGVATPGEYVISHRGAFTALDRDSGQILWSAPPPPKKREALLTGFPGGPVLVGDLAIAAASDGVIYAYPLPAAARPR